MNFYNHLLVVVTLKITKSVTAIQKFVFMLRKVCVSNHSVVLKDRTGCIWKALTLCPYQFSVIDLMGNVLEINLKIY